MDASRWSRVRRWWSAYHWVVIGVVALATTWLGYAGFRGYLGTDARTEWDFLYLSLQLFVLESGDVTGPAPLSLEISRLLAPAIAAYAIAAVVIEIFREQWVGLQTRFRSGHVIVCGLEAGWTLTRMLRASDESVVVIERDPAHPRIETCRSGHILVLVGDARDEQLLRQAGILRARRLFALCGNDGINIKVAEQARRLSTGRSRVRFRGSDQPLRVLVHVESPYLCSALTMRELERTAPDNVRLDFFSLYAGGARALLNEYALTSGPADEARTPHIAVVGLGRLGRQLVVQAARNWRAEGHPHTERLWVTVVDADAEAHATELRRSHRFLDQSCELVPLDLPPDPLPRLDAGDLYAPGRPDVSTVFVCLPDDAQGLGVGVSLHRELRHRGVPVVVRTYDADLAALLPAVPESPAADLYMFDQLDRSCRPEEIFAGETERLARAIHETYVRQQRGRGQTPATNPSLVEWTRLPKEKKDANWGQAEHIPVKLAALGCEIGPLVDPDAELFTFTPAEVDLLGRMEHERWLADADPDHPFSVEWDALDEATKEIDRNFVRRMPALLATVGFQINRRNRQADATPWAGELPATRRI